MSRIRSNTALLRMWRALVVVLILAIPASAAADGPALPAAPAASATLAAPTAPTAPASTGVEAPVTLHHRRIAVMRATAYGTPAPERARRASARLDALLSASGATKISVVSELGVSFFLIDGSLAFMLSPGDVDALSGETLEQATRATRAALEQVAAETREARDHKQLWRALGRSAIATLALLFIIVLVLRTRSWLVRRLAARLTDSASHLASTRLQALYAPRLFGLSRWLVRTSAGFVLLLALYRWTTFVLGQFPYTRAWGEELDGYLLGALRTLGGSLLRALPDLLVAGFIGLLARVVIAAARPVFDGIERRQMDVGWLDADTAKPTRRIFALLVWVAAVVMAYPYLPGSGSEAFKGVSVLIGLMVTLGGSSLFGQAASGLILLYSRTLRIGEFIRVGEHEGTVTELGVFTTRISTGLGEYVSLPNAWVLGNVTTNYSRPTGGKGYTLRTKVTIGYDTPWRQVEGMLLEAARRIPGVASEPPPQVFQLGLSDFYIEYELVCQAAQVSAKGRAEALSSLNAAVIDAFNEYGVQIMSPHYFTDPASRKVVPKPAWHAAPAAAAAKPPEGA